MARAGGGGDEAGGRRFLFALIDAGGTVPPAMALAGELVRRGHAVRVLADPTVADSARAAGCAFVPWTRAPHFSSRGEQTAVIAAAEGGNPVRAVRTLRAHVGPDMSSRFARDVVDAARQFPVDAVLADPIPGILIGAQATGLPTAALVAQAYPRPTPGVPLLGTGWSPAPGLGHRMRDRLAPAAASRLLRFALPRLNKAATAFGQPALRDFFDLFDRCTRVLVLTSPSFDFPVPHLPANVRFVGPQLDDPDWASRSDWWRIEDRPLVLVGTSSVFQHQTDLLARIVLALRALPVSAVVGTGRAVEPGALPRASNVCVVRAAPHREILREASLVITHAGHGTVMKALAAGVPLICMPMGRDQKDNTARVLRQGAGLRLTQRSTSQQIAAAVKEVLGTPAYAAAARRFADVLAAESRAGPTAADEAEALLR